MQPHWIPTPGQCKERLADLGRRPLPADLGRADLAGRPLPADRCRQTVAGRLRPADLGRLMWLAHCALKTSTADIDQLVTLYSVPGGVDRCDPTSRFPQQKVFLDVR
jgi:hypothetical protein